MNIDGVAQALEGFNTDAGPASTVFNWVMIPFKWILGPLAFGTDRMVLLKMGLSMGITMVALIVAGMLLQNEYKSDSALHIIGIVLLLWAIVLCAQAIISVGSSEMLPTIKATAVALLVLFEALSIAALASLLGFISKQSS